MNDLYILNGISEIVNKDNTRTDIDVNELERTMIQKGLIQESKVPQEDKLMREIQETVSKLGISFDDVTSKKGSESEYRSEPQREHQRDNQRDSQRETQSDYRDEPSRSSKYHIDFDDIEPSNDQLFDQKTREEQRRAHINNVLETNKNINDFSLETERAEDERASMLAEIDYLMEGLKDEGVDISRIPHVSDDSNNAAIEKVLKVLRHKVDHSRYCTFAEEFILTGAHGLEYLFDGKNTWFGQWNPDLTGWHVHVNRKLRRMRTDTGKIVSQIMSENDIGPFMRVFLELIPSMLLFSKKRSEQNNLSTLNLNDDGESNRKLRDL